jgi:hypothetical protein
MPKGWSAPRPVSMYTMANMCFHLSETSGTLQRIGRALGATFGAVGRRTDSLRCVRLASGP